MSSPVSRSAGALTVLAGPPGSARPCWPTIVSQAGAWLGDSEDAGVDLGVAFCGIAPEIVDEAEVVLGVRISVTRVGRLMVLKLMSVREGREAHAAAMS